MPKTQKGFDFMDDWKERLVEEYHQLKERWEKLKAFNNRREVDEGIGKVGDMLKDNREAAREYDYCSCLLKGQQRVMGEYLHILELRAELEGIEL